MSLRENNKPSICFIAHFAFGALSGGTSGHIGGVERQTSMMARWFANQGYKISLVTWDEGQEDGVVIDGVKVFKLCKESDGIPGLRFLWPRWSSLVNALQRADADIYYHNCGEYVTGQIALWCRQHGRKFVYSSANDTDCDRRLPEMHKIRERVLYRYGLKNADQIIVQTRRQQEMLKRGFSMDSEIIPMPCPGPSDEDFKKSYPEKCLSNRILWIGRICEQKRPDRLLDLAVANPDLQIDLVGPSGNSKYAAMVCSRASTLPNVKCHGPARGTEVNRFYRQARIMCCTSDFEGFPNTFLEAWSWGVPIISTFDPDNLIKDKGLGRMGADVTELANGIRELLNSPQQWANASQAARAYYSSNHAIDMVMLRFEQIFNAIHSIMSSQT